MKNLSLLTQITFILYLITTNLGAKITRGGVDVGNGKIFVHKLATLDYEIEQNLVYDIEDQMKDIQNAQHPEVMKAAFEGMCETNSVEFLSLSISDYYPKSFEVKYRFAKKRYQGEITVGLKDCLVPEMITLNQDDFLFLK